MSYILEALKRSEQERHQGELAHATIDTIMMPSKQVRHQWWPYLLIVVLIINLLAFLYFQLIDDSVAPEVTDIVAQQDASNNEYFTPQVIETSTVQKKVLSEKVVAQSSNEKPIPAHLTQTPTLTKRYDLNDYLPQKGLVVSSQAKQKNYSNEGLEIIKPKSVSRRISSEVLMVTQGEQQAIVEQQVEEGHAKIENFEDIYHLNDLDLSFQKNIPNLRFNSHIYSVNPSDRRVMINDLYLREGQGFAGMTIETIGEFYIILSKGSQSFKIPVLRDWFAPE